MRESLKVGFLSIALSQALFGVDATAWWQLDRVNFPPLQPPGPVIINDPLVIWENSTLHITSTNGPQNGVQTFAGDIIFNHNLAITLTANDWAANSTTPIYQLNGAQQKSFSGAGTLSLVIEAPNRYAKSIFNLDGTGTQLDIGVKTIIKTTDNSNLYSVFRVGNTGGGSTLTFTNDLIVDVSNSKGSFPGNAGGNVLGGVIFDVNTNSTLKVNANKSTAITTQLKGDIAFLGGTAEINLLNAQSFIQGKILAQQGGNNALNFSNGASGNITLFQRQNGNATFNLNNNANLKLKANFLDNTGNLTLIANHSSLFADFTYQNQNPPAQNAAVVNITLNSGGVWYLSQSNQINTLSISNPNNQVTSENLKSLSNLSAVDMRFKDQGATLRNDLKLDANNRYTLTTTQIQGNNGVFRIFGVLNRNGWTKVQAQPPNAAQDETIATDQIITEGVFNTHYLQVFWNSSNFDKSLLNKNLEGERIVVAKQTGLNGNGDFIGAVTPIGLYNYITNLKKEILQGQGGVQAGWQWIVQDVQRADNSYLSRLLDSLFQSQYRIFKMETDTLNLRLGELRDMRRVHGIWLRTKYGRLGSKATKQTAPSWDEFTSIWMGYDQNFYVLGGRNFLGFAFNTTAFRNHGIADGVDPSGESYYASSRTYGLSIYNTYFFDNGLYIDGIAKYYLVDNDYSINSEVLNGNYPKFFTHGLIASLEVGKKFKLPIITPDFKNSFYYLKPEAQFTLGFISGTDQSLKDWSNQYISSRLDYNIPAVFRLGLMFGREFNKRSIRGDIYLGSSLEYDVNSGGDLRLEDFLDKMTLIHRGNFNLRINLGTNLILNEYWRIYFDLDTSFFGYINSTFTLNGGVRINFGRLHPTMPYITPDQDIFIQDPYRKDRRTIPEVQNYETREILDSRSGKKRNFYKPPVKIAPRKYQDNNPNNHELDVKIKPKVKAMPKGEPTFIDNPQNITAPQKNYTRDTNAPISPNAVPQTRDMQEIRETLNRGFRR